MVLIYAKEEVSAQCDKELSDCNKEILWCRLAGGNILAGVCYISTSNMQEEEAKIHSNIIKACSRTSNKEVMLCGDFNHNNINWIELEATAEGQAFVDLTQDLDLIQHVETATRHGNVLDLVLTTTPNLVRDVHVIEPFGSSDHNIVEFTMVYRTEYTDWKKYYYDYRNGDYVGMKEYLQRIDLRSKLSRSNCSTEEAWTILKASIEEAVSKFVPKKVRRKRSNKPLRWN